MSARSYALACVVLGALGCQEPERRNLPHDLSVEESPDLAMCEPRCAADGRAVLDCGGAVVSDCADDGKVCDPSTTACVDMCTFTANNKSSVGCEYYAVHMQSSGGGTCFAVFVANTQSQAVKLKVERNGVGLPMASFTRIPSGGGTSIHYQPYDDAVGVPAGEVAILFLSGAKGDLPACPIDTAAGPTAMVQGSGIGAAFHITSELPVVAYQINPYGGGQSATTGASLLIPTSAWGKEYIGVNAGAASSFGSPPSMDIIALENYTQVTITPVADVAAAAGIPATSAGTPLHLTLQKGSYAQLSQVAELTGSIITADKPVGLLGGNVGLQVPIGTNYEDHAEQMIPPVNALGSEYASVMHRPRIAEPAVWRMVGAVDDTQLTYSSDVGGPATLKRGQIVEFSTATPFVVRSQDAAHPFMTFELMAGSQSITTDLFGPGDPDFVLIVPSLQYGKNYVFFADPTYPETNLVLVRHKDAGSFADVTLDCAGVLTDWHDIAGDTDYQWTRVDLSTGDFKPVAGCGNGRHEIHSDAPFGLWVWGWGTEATTPRTTNVSYGYPAGMSLEAINAVTVQ